MLGFLTPVMASIATASAWFPPLSVVNNISTGTQALALGVSTIGALGGLYVTWKHGHDMSGTLHKTAEVVVLGSLCTGIGTVFSMLPGVTAALLH